MAGSSESSETSIGKITNIKHVKMMTLNRENYFYWRPQFATALNGYKLLSYIDGTVTLSDAIANQQDQH